MTRIKLLIWVVLFLAVSCTNDRYAGPMSPEESLAAITLDENFDIEIFAAEPFIRDPVEMVFDDEGNAYVVEMPDYPFRPESGIGSGRIVMVSDSSGDGRVDKVVVFADSLLEATSIMPWNGGLLVTAAPEIFFLRDTNDDNRADLKEVLFTGFFSNNSETQITNLRFAVDNWIYASNFGQEGNVKYTKNPAAKPLSTKGGDFRFRLDRGLFEVETGPTQFGQTIDQWGHRFITENSIHVQQSVFPWRYVHRHEHLAPGKSLVNISDHEQLMFQATEAPYWRAERTKRRNQAFQENKLNRVEYADDHFTAASGTTIYLGDAFPEKYYGNIFIGDVSGNLVHRDVMTPVQDSVVYVARRAEDDREKEFLTSTDTWFRPANFTVGPDGSLYVIDMYRQHIEGPPFIPEDLRAELNFMNGSDMGRIYRIIPKNKKLQQAAFNLRNTPSADLVKLLSHSNEWWRLQAHRILVERQDTSVVSLLKELFRQSDDPGVRLHSLYTLEALNSMDAKLAGAAIKDKHPGVRESGIILSEKYPGCVQLVVDALKDSSARVALQATLSIGEFSGAQVLPAFAEVIRLRGNDRWFRTAVLSSEAGSSMSLLRLMAKQGLFADSTQPYVLNFLEEFSYVVGSRQKDDEIVELLTRFSNKAQNDDLPISILQGLGKAIKNLDGKFSAGASFTNALNVIEKNSSPAVKDAVAEVNKLLSSQNSKASE